MKKLKLLLIVISCILTVLTAYIIVKTYAVFESNLSTTSQISVGKWRIAVNEDDVTSGSVHEFTIDNINIDQNVNVKQGKFAPGTTGDFQIEILPQDTQVSVRYDIFIDDSDLDSDQIRIGTISETNHNKQLIRTDERTYSQTILLSQMTNGYSDNINIEFEWVNDENNNEIDSAIGNTYNSTISVPITVKFTQYLGEQITEYNEED